MHEAPRLVFRPPPNQRHDERESDRKLRPLPKVSGRTIGRLAYVDNSSPLISSKDLDLIRVILRDHGFERAPVKVGAVAPVDDWSLFWYANDLQPDMLKLLETLRPHQRINKIPGSAALTNKTNLWKCFARMQEAHGWTSFGFMPLSFVLPLQLDECEAFIRARTAEKAADATRDEHGDIADADAVDDVYILKPAVLSRGHGISLYRPGPESGWGSSWDASFRRVRSHTGLCSTYIHPPMLLDGLKSDMRLYVLVTGVCPLTVYIFAEGLTRFATEKYDISAIDNRFQHLTNYSLNKKSSSFVKTTSESLDDDGAGSKWSLGAFRRRLVAEFGQARAEQVWRDIDDLVLKTVIAAEPTFHEQMASYSPPYRRGELPKHCFQLFGFDVMLSSDLKPWLLEVNCDPALGTEQALDLRVKAPMLLDALNLVGVPTPPPPAEQSQAANGKQPPSTPLNGGGSNPFELGRAATHSGALSSNPPPASPEPPRPMWSFVAPTPSPYKRPPRTPYQPSDYEKWVKASAAPAAAPAAGEEPHAVDATDGGEADGLSGTERRRQQQQRLKRQQQETWALHMVNAEFKRSKEGGWRRLFPSARGEEYSAFFDEERRAINCLPFDME